MRKPEAWSGGQGLSLSVPAPGNSFTIIGTSHKQGGNQMSLTVSRPGVYKSESAAVPHHAKCSHRAFVVSLQALPWTQSIKLLCSPMTEAKTFCRAATEGTGTEYKALWGCLTIFSSLVLAMQKCKLFSLSAFSDIKPKFFVCVIYSTFSPLSSEWFIQLFPLEMQIHHKGIGNVTNGWGK